MNETPLDDETVVVVLVTAPTAETASHIGREVVERKLAACANLVPGIHSIFSWQGSIEEAQEVLLVMKTTSRSYQELEQAITSLHPYETPEVLAIPVSAGFAPYLAWVRTETIR